MLDEVLAEVGGLGLLILYTSLVLFSNWAYNMFVGDFAR